VNGKPEYTTEDTQKLDERIILNIDRRENANRTKLQKRIHH
jgi:hypothetical protein